MFSCARGDTNSSATRSGGWVWKGRLLDVDGEASFAIHDGVVAGTVFAGDKVFEILFTGGDEHEVTRNRAVGVSDR